VDVLLVSPKDPGSRSGNGVTARRWAGILRELGHRVRIGRRYPEDDDPGARGAAGPDLLVALHARRSSGSVLRFRRDRPEAPVVLALTGTDLYRDLERSVEAREAVEAADRLVVLQEKALERLSPETAGRTRVIHQSAEPPPGEHPPREDVFEVCLLCHMRPVKDPFRAPEAARRLPSDSRLEVVHAGAALTDEMEERARREAAENPRYRWLGEVPRREALGLLARSRALVVSSRLEGGANVVTEALACGTPVVGSRIDGTVGLLGEDYPGYYPVGDTGALAARLHRLEVDDGYRRTLEEACSRRADRAAPEREARAWADLLEGMPRPTGSGGSG
jgi:putative glycosyltransferase (TIGR04348 family)